MTKQKIDERLDEVEVAMRRVYLATGGQKYKKADVRDLIHKMADRITDLRCELYPATERAADEMLTMDACEKWLRDTDQTNGLKGEGNQE